MTKLYNNLTERFLHHIVVDDKGCWIWNSEQTTNGYGRITIYENKKRKRIRAHRLSYELFKGKITDDMVVCHSCDVKLCVNPEHLWLGTHQDNMEDAYRKGIIKRGSEANKAKLTEDNVRKIKELYASNNYTYKQLGEMYNVNFNTIRFIIIGRTWRHVM